MRLLILAKRHIDQPCEFIDFEAVGVGCEERDKLPLCFAVALGLVGTDGGLKPARCFFRGLPGFFRVWWLLGTVKARASRAPEKEQKRCRRPVDPEIPAINTRQHRDHGSTGPAARSEEHTSELQSHLNLVCRLLLEKKKKKSSPYPIHQGPRSDTQHDRPYTGTSGL